MEAYTTDGWMEGRGLTALSWRRALVLGE